MRDRAAFQGRYGQQREVWLMASMVRSGLPRSSFGPQSSYFLRNACCKVPEYENPLVPSSYGRACELSDLDRYLYSDLIGDRGVNVDRLIRRPNRNDQRVVGCLIKAPLARPGAPPSQCRMNCN